VKHARDWLVSLLVLGALGACKKTPEPTASNNGPSLLEIGSQAKLAPSALPAPTPAMSAPEPVPLTWVDPTAWKLSPRKSPMRKATYVIPKASADAEDGELAIFYFGPGQGGSVDANVDRWVKQFKEVPPEKVKRADRQANGLVQHTVEIESGTFDGSQMSAAPSKPKEKYGLLGAIVTAPGGSYFFKLTGPSATVQAARKDFYGLLDSVKAGS
jgi:hypothetical protein